MYLRYVYDLIVDAQQQSPKGIALSTHRDGHWLEITYEQLFERCQSYANELIHLGIKAGDRVVVMTSNQPECIYAIFAILKLKATVVLIDQNHPDEILKELTEFSDAKAIYIQPGFFKHLSEIAIDLPRIDLMNGQLHKHSNYQHTNHLPATQDGDSEIAFILFSSGTTGTPHGVMLSHKNIFFQIDIMKKIAQRQHCDEFHVHLMALPIFHVYPLAGGLLPAISLKAKIALLPKVTPEDLMLYFQYIRPNCFCSVPRILEIFSEKINSKLDSLTKSKKIIFKIISFIVDKSNKWLNLSLQKFFYKKIHQGFGGNIFFFGCGGSKLDKNTFTQLKHFGFDVLEGYGLTETTSAVIMNYDSNRLSNTLGKPFSEEVQVKIHNPDENNHGEICIKCPGIMLGYFRNQEATEKTLIDGYLHTGDLGSIDESGVVHLYGRIKEIIVTAGGKNVNPIDIENHIKDLPYIVECAAFAVARDQDDCDELHLAIVIDSSGDDVDINQRQEEINQNIHEVFCKLPAHFQIHQTHFMHEIPKTNTLKVKRKKLAEIVNNIRNNKDQQYVAPRTELESILISIYQKYFSDPEIGIEHDFFSLGGDSMMAGEVILALSNQLDLIVPVQIIFLNPVIKDFANFIEKNKNKYSQKQIPALAVDDPLRYELSFNERRVLEMATVHQSSTYNIPFVFRIEHLFDKDVLENSIDAIQQRQEILRTSYQQVEAGYQRIIHEKNAVNLEFHTLDSLENNHLTVDELINQFTHFHFKPTEGLLVTITVIQLDSTRSIFAVNLHHVIADMEALMIFVNELLEHYFSTLNQQESQLATLEIQYADFSAWQNNGYNSVNYELEAIYWANKLVAYQPPELPEDIDVDINRAYVKEIPIAFEQYQALSHLSSSLKVSNFVTLMTCYHLALCALFNLNSTYMRLPFNNRLRKELQHLIGYTTYGVGCYLEMAPELTVNELLERNKAEVIEQKNYYISPLGKLMRSDKLSEELFPRFELNYINIKETEIAGHHIEALPISYDVNEMWNREQFPIDFSLFNLCVGEQLYVKLISRQRYTNETIVERFIMIYQFIIESIIDDSDMTVKRLIELSQDRYMHDKQIVKKETG